MSSEEKQNDQNGQHNDNPQHSLDRESLINSFKAKKKGYGIFGLVLMGLIVLALFFMFQDKGPQKDGLDKEPVAFEPATRRPVVIPKAPLAIEPQIKENDALKETRLKSAIVIFGGSSQNSNVSSRNTESSNPDPNGRFQENIQRTQKTKAIPSTGLGQTILAGKLIDAVLETAISSDLPGMVRALVSHDVYGEEGNQVLIPRGSRLIGQYNSAIRKGQSRVFVVWTRVMRPDGIQIELNSGGTDSLGRAGIGGSVNHHFWQMFGTSILLSMIGAGTANVGVNATDPYNSASAYRQQLAEAFQNSANQALADNINIPPTINVKHGTLIKIFVAQDLDFSEALASQPHNDFVFIP